MNETEDTLLHMLGLNRDNKVPWRNHFAGTSPEIEELVRSGFAKKIHDGSEITGFEPVYVATEEGKRHAIIVRDREYPKLSRSKQRYLDYLNADSGMKFGEWLRCGYYKQQVHYE